MAQTAAHALDVAVRRASVAPPRTDIRHRRHRGGLAKIRLLTMSVIMIELVAAVTFCVHSLETGSNQQHRADLESTRQQLHSPSKQSDYRQSAHTQRRQRALKRSALAGGGQVEPGTLEEKEKVKVKEEEKEKADLTSDGLSRSLIMLADDDDDDNEANIMPNKPANNAKLNTMRRLVRQLTQLVMNNEPESIAEHMGHTKISGQMVSESGLEESGAGGSGAGELKQQGHQLDSAASTSAWTGSGGTIDAAQIKTAASEQPEVGAQADSNASSEPDPMGQPESGSSTATGADEQLITCAPDYDDQPPIIDSNISGNLTAEQQQQLFVDSSELLSTRSSSTTMPGELVAGTATKQLATTTSRTSPYPINCVHPGNRMIEVITKVITPILFSIIIVVGLLGNIIVMLVILEDRKTERELTPTNLLILDLSLADLSFIIFCIPFTGWDYSVGHWVFGQLWCKFNQYLIVVCALSSIYTLVLMSVDRFMAIVYPIECISYRTSKNTLYAIYIKWILILLIASPVISMHGLVDLPFGEPGQYNCRFLIDQYNPLHFQIAFFVTSYLFPLILIFCLYLSLLNKLWFGTKPHGHKESHKMLESKKKVTWLVAGIVVVFALCWCPIQVMLILMRLKSHRITATYVAIQVFSHILGYMNSCVNPIVYAFASETFHNSFKRSSFGRFFCRLCCCNSNPDRDRSHSNAHRLGTPQSINTTVTISLNHNKNLANQQPQQKASNNVQTNKNGSLRNDNNISTTTMLITPYSSENSTKTAPLEPRDRGLPPLSSSQRSNDENTKTQVRGATSVSPSQQTEAQLQQQPLDLSNNEEPSAGSSTQPTTLPKQQLVAHVVQSSGNQVSHRCEPGYYQDSTTP